MPDGSVVPVMHGYGHDTHITVGLTAAQLMTENRDAWVGTAVFIFQPGEETAAGAKAMVEDGLWDKAPKPTIIYGQHVWPGLAGTVNLSKGTAMAMADSWKVTVHGKQSHGSQPEQSIVSRQVHPMKSAVVTIGTFHGGLKENIIPASAEFTLNVRTFDHDVRDLVLGSLRRIISAEAAASGAPEPSIEEISSFPQRVLVLWWPPAGSARWRKTSRRQSLPLLRTGDRADVEHRRPGRDDRPVVEVGDSCMSND